MNKKYLALMALLFSSLSMFALAEIWVAPEGSDKAPGTKAEPKASLHSALRLAREWRRLSDPSIADGIIIKMQAGSYFLD
ncbi:MAG: right-handed parallel beta-helix repeat-containing protein, partial [Bacteroidales bacterium]|nr:right-handed parallel beta-helix repeat-containing protein [Bacteroidales bacterium]